MVVLLLLLPTRDFAQQHRCCQWCGLLSEQSCVL
jgi:hypothetical protein